MVGGLELVWSTLGYAENSRKQCIAGLSEDGGEDPNVVPLAIMWVVWTLEKKE